MASIEASNGKYRVRYLDPGAVGAGGVRGKYRSKTFTLKKDAAAYKRKVETELETGAHLAATERLTVKEAGEKYLRFQEMRLRDGRISRGRFEQLKNLMDVSVFPLIGRKVLHDLTALDVERFYGDMCSARRPVSAPTARSRVTELQALSRWAVTRGYAGRPLPGEAVRELRGIKAEPIKTFTTEQVSALMAAAEVKPYRGEDRCLLYRKCYLHLALFCGLRYGEITALTPEAFDFDRRIVRVRHSLDRWGTLRPPKTRAGNRDVPMPRHLVLLCREWVDRYTVANPLRLALVTREGLALENTVFRNGHWYPLLDRAGLRSAGDRYHFHALRHFAASLFIQSGMPLNEVARVMGHTHLDMTLQVYTHSVRGAEPCHRVVDRMADFLMAGPVLTIPPAPEITLSSPLES